MSVRIAEVTVQPPVPDLLQAPPAQAPPRLDLGYVMARPIVTLAWKTLHLVQVGCGGTGSWLTPSLARLVKVLGEVGRSADLTLIDPDLVERGNVPRQNFCAAEIGTHKARTLALRYGSAWGLDIRVRMEAFKQSHLIGMWGSRDSLIVIVGCVDNAAARRSINDTLHYYNNNTGGTVSPPSVWWLDCGNARDGGQVLLGCAPTVENLRGAFDPATICRSLPSPALQRPELLEPLPDELPAARERLSCVQLALLNGQSLFVNERIAVEAADYLLRLVMTGDLRKFATFIDLPTGVSKSHYTTPEAVAASIGMPVGIFGSSGSGEGQR